MSSSAAEPIRHRRRWVWALPIAVLVAAVLVAGLSRRSSSTADAHGQAGPGNSSPALQSLGAVTWTTPVLQPDGRSVAVTADVNHTPNYCLDDGLPVLKAVATESTGTVRIVVQAFRRLPRPTYSLPAGAVQACSSVGHVPIVVLAELGAPLAGRSVLGGSGPLRSAAGFPAPGYLPAGYTGGAVTAGTDEDAALYRVYQHGDDQLSVRRAGPGFPHPQVVARASVRGRPAQVQRDPDYSGSVCATWAEPDASWSVCSLGRTAAPLGAAELFKVADSLH